MKKRVKLDEKFTPAKIAQALSDGRILYTKNGGTLFYDANNGNPFRFGSEAIDTIWQRETLYEDIEIEWPHQDLCPCLCWVKGGPLVIVTGNIDANNAITTSGDVYPLNDLQPFTKEDSDELTLKVD